MRMIPSERLKGIEAFVVSADTGSFSAAAERLNLTGSAISKGVARLEARLGSRLFARTTRRLTLTDQGTAFYATCVRVLAELGDAEAVLAAHATEPVGRLKINVPVAFGRIQVMPVLLAFCERHPKLRPDIAFTDRFVDVIEDGVDIAVRIGASDVGTGLGYRGLGHEHLVFCAAPDYLARRGTPASVDALADHDCILYGRGDGSRVVWRYGYEGGVVEQRTMTGRMTLGSAEAQVEAVKAGLGIAQLATWLVREELRHGTLIEVLPEHATAGLALHLVWPRSRQLNPKVDAFVEALAEGLRIV